MRDCFFKQLTIAAKKNKNIFLVVADIGFGVINEFKKTNPNQFINVGVAEQNMIGIATGLALSGKKVFCYSIGNFPTLRCLEQIRNDVCYHNLDIKIVTVGGGYSYGSLGYSHHALEDIGIMRCLPNVKVFVPSSDFETLKITNFLTKYNKPCYLRLDKSSINYHSKFFNINKPNLIKTTKKSSIILLATGGVIEEVLIAEKLLKKNKINCGIFSIFNLSDHNKAFFNKFIKSKIFCIEEHVGVNGLYAFICDNIKRKNNIHKIAINKDKILTVAGSQKYLRNLQGISANKMKNFILKNI